MTYPHLDPVALQLGPLTIKWYGLSYVLSIWGVVFLIKRWSQTDPRLSPPFVDGTLPWGVCGIVMGGRLGHACFYNGAYYLHHPLELLKIWQGGMSFHGGMLGLGAALALYCYRHHRSFWVLMDYVACATPWALMFGRLANFINGELYGRISDVPWAMVFPQGGPWPRHPSQLYEAALEGILLGIILSLWRRRTVGGIAHLKPGAMSGGFLLGYGLLRSIAEIWRDPDVAPLLTLGDWLTPGQTLCLPMIFGGLLLLMRHSSSQRTQA